MKKRLLQSGQVVLRALINSFKHLAWNLWPHTLSLRTSSSLYGPADVLGAGVTGASVILRPSSGLQLYAGCGAVTVPCTAGVGVDGMVTHDPESLLVAFEPMLWELSTEAGRGAGVMASISTAGAGSLVLSGGVVWELAAAVAT